VTVADLSSFLPGDTVNRVTSLALLMLLGLPLTALAQGSPMVRVTGTEGMYMSAAYDNLTNGKTLGIDALFGTRSRFGIGLRYAEYPISDQSESLVSGGADLVLDMTSPRGFYVEARGGYEVQGFDVVDTRYVYQGFHAGGVAGWLQAFGPVWADVGIELGYFSSFAAWANDTALDDSLSGVNLGLRLGIALAPGGE
jgi:hypothetical protein